MSTETAEKPMRIQTGSLIENHISVSTLVKHKGKQINMPKMLRINESKEDLFSSSEASARLKGSSHYSQNFMTKRINPEGVRESYTKEKLHKSILPEFYKTGESSKVGKTIPKTVIEEDDIDPK